MHADESYRREGKGEEMAQMAPDAGVVGTGAPFERYAEVQQFYAWQMGLLDDGAADEWADTFTEDAIFDEPSLAAPLLGREAIRESVRARVARLAAEGVTIRHWFNMITVEPMADGELRARSYALTLSTAPGADLTVRGHAICLDLLVPHGSGWLVRHRQIRPDNRAAAPTR